MLGMDYNHATFLNRISQAPGDRTGTYNDRSP